MSRSMSLFYKEGESIAVNITQGSGCRPASTVGVRKLECGIKISAVHHLVLSQYMHLTDRRTDRRTELREQYRALHYMQSHRKNNPKSVRETNGKLSLL